ncbi:MAG: DUF3124 domain-containing protein [Burkholderiales bacterium]|nr:DUF3124 domain-containing protein [Anaerolineae bacterium]
MTIQRAILIAAVSLVSVVTAACASQETASTPAPTQALQPVDESDLQIVMGQIVYVPAYGEIYNGDGLQAMQLAVTLAIHNSDTDAPIIIQSVQYFDTDGNLVRDYISDPVEISPLATTGFVVESGDNSGGWGSNFLVEWGAEQPVYEPVIEAIMISTQGTHGVSLISTGRVVHQTMPDDTSAAE